MFKRIGLIFLLAAALALPGGAPARAAALALQARG